MDEYREIQENLFEYFNDTDDNTLIKFIDSFVYHVGTSDIRISQLVEKFLDDNGLKQAHLNYVYDLRHPKRYFNKSDLSQTEMLNQIRTGLLSLAFNRFSASNSKPKKQTSTFTKLNKLP